MHSADILRGLTLTRWNHQPPKKNGTRRYRFPFNFRPNQAGVPVNAYFRLLNKSRARKTPKPPRLHLQPSGVQQGLGVAAEPGQALGHAPAALKPACGQGHPHHPDHPACSFCEANPQRPEHPGTGPSARATAPQRLAFRSNRAANSAIRERFLPKSKRPKVECER